MQYPIKWEFQIQLEVFGSNEETNPKIVVNFRTKIWFSAPTMIGD